MNAKPYDPFDLHRILLGEPSWQFLIEVALRATLTYVALQVAMRLLGRRVAGQATLFEISVVVLLAAAIGAPLQAPDRGIVAPLLILITAVLLHRGLGAWAVRSARVEALATGRPVTLLRDGRLDVHSARSVVLSRDKLFAMLRAREIQHLGELHRVQLEANGSLSVVKALRPTPGLSILPEIDAELRNEPAVSGRLACNGCGHVRSGGGTPACSCPHCDNDTWSPCVRRLEP